MEKDTHVVCKYGILFPKEEANDNVIEVAKHKDVLTYMGTVSSDKDLPDNPKNGEMYIADKHWKSKKLNNVILVGDTLIYSTYDNTDWTITRSASSVE